MIMLPDAAMTSEDINEGSLPEEARGMRHGMGLLSEHDLSALIGVQVRTLQKWRCLKTGPDFVRLGKVVFYRRADIEKWIELNVVPTKRVMHE